MKKILLFALILMSTSTFFSQVSSKYSDTELKTVIKKINNYSYYKKIKNSLVQEKSLKYFLDSVIVFEDSTGSNGFKKDQKQVLHYGSENKIANFEILSWNESMNQWDENLDYQIGECYYLNDFDFGIILTENSEKVFRIEYKHDSNGILILTKIFEFNTDFNFWFNTLKEEISYNQSNFQNKTIFQRDELDTTLWNNFSKVDYSYNLDNNLLDSIEYFDYESTPMNYNIYSKIEFRYNDLNLIDTIFSYEEFSQDSMIVTFTEVFFYDNNLITESIYYHTFSSGFYRNKYYYDLNGNMSKYEYSSSNLGTDYPIRDRYFYYNYSINSQDLFFQDLHEFSFNDYYWDNSYIDSRELTSFRLLPFQNYNLLDSTITYELAGTPNTIWKSDYHYSQRELSLNTILDNPIKIYPNPTTNFINIEESLKFESFELIDIKGQIVRKEKLNSSKIDVSNLQNGIYFLNLYTNNKTIVRSKIIKE
ncbi:MAG: T9SS type A sorting domain-containing protein [Bacteroidota bacterium]